MQRQPILLTLALASSLLFLAVFSYIGWEAFKQVFGSQTKAAFAIFILLLDGIMIIWLRFMCTNLVKCHQFVERLAGTFIALIMILGLFDASVLIIEPQALTSAFCTTFNAVLFAVLLMIGFLLAWETINITFDWIRGAEALGIEEKPNVEQKYGKAGYR